MAEATVDACTKCGEPYVPVALVIAFERAVAAELARRGPISGETLRWIRKAAALERMDMSQLLGVSVETIASWEEGRRPMDVAAWTVIASLALDAIEGPRPLRARMKARRRNAGASGTAALTLQRANAGSLARVLELLAGSAGITDADIADALDVDCAALRARLRELATHGLVRSTTGAAQDEAIRWEPTTRDREALLQAAADAGVDLDALLPRAKRAPDMRWQPVRPRASATWRAST
jgi:DNA-binding transcriptional regulator YiaG/DNA-binding MarR family transcriptional regulator